MHCSYIWRPATFILRAIQACVDIFLVHKAHHRSSSLSVCGIQYEISNILKL
jgi:hypothetical protein